MDETDECPLFDLRISSKPTEYLMNEDLECHGLGMPDEKL